MKKAIIHVMLKNGVLDPQGKAIGQALHGMGFDEVGTVRQGKVIEMEIKGEADQKRLAAMCEKLLANPVIEDYRIEMA
ncbi:MAG: phosphoribosylformylglycinamidine synthase subunit PurS [Alphaproteobacteria bacterium]|jgi:phosphoribosylformylglycinamidine synthase|nr:phosphoribosylformylglycinamidine synthase subunit PurS [Alphaproteobacteria bacterium]MBU0859995.1 phosphoribosylformylglycinamidine synthase subunit PurS [Alphaproteobacteria bacterium]